MTYDIADEVFTIGIDGGDLCRALKTRVSLI